MINHGFLKIIIFSNTQEISKYKYVYYVYEIPVLETDSFRGLTWCTTINIDIYMHVLSGSIPCYANSSTVVIQIKLEISVIIVILFLSCMS